MRSAILSLLATLVLCACLPPAHAAPVTATRAKPATTRDHPPAREHLPAPNARPAFDESKVFTLDHALTLRSVASPTWSGDGTRLAFVATEVDTAEDSNNQEVWMVDLARGESIRLTRHPKNDFSPTFSPGGDTLAFVGNRGTGEDAKSAIYLMSLHGRQPWAFGT